MAILIGILKFLFGAIAVFFTDVFILSCIASIVNPQLGTEGENVVEKGDKPRIMFAIIMAVAWGIVIAL